MTVAIAAICYWRYEPNDDGWAVITASDRILTNGDIEYEPFLRKMCYLGPKILLLVSGEMQIHTDVIRITQRQLIANPDSNVRSVAELYATNVRAFRMKWAVQQYLSVYGLNEKSFLENQKHMSPELIRDLAHKVEGVNFNIEAIVAGLNESGEADICNIDGYGFSACQTDMGFVSIGAGSGHANLQMMMAQYSSISNNFHRTLALLYTAKKRAEMAPGVGSFTDMNLITRAGVENITSENLSILDGVYNEWMNESRQISERAFTNLESRMKDAHKKEVDETQKLMTQDYPINPS